jgi:hypothetical protein
LSQRRFKLRLFPDHYQFAFKSFIVQPRAQQIHVPRVVLQQEDMRDGFGFHI